MPKGKSGLADWNLLQVLLEVARAGSMRNAQKALNQTQPTIGRKIDQLEQMLGVKLLIRTAGGVSLTHAGERVVAYAQQIESIVRGAALERLSAHDVAGTVRIKASDGIVGYWIPHMLATFPQEYPHITIHAVCSDVATMPDLTRREADITVVYAPPTDPDVVVLDACHTELLFFASSGYADQNGLPRTLGELLDHRICAHDAHLAVIEPWKTYAEVLGRHERIVYRSNSSLALGQALRAGLGIGLQPAGVADREPEMIAFRVEGYAPELPFWLVSHRNVKDLPAIRAVIDHIKKVVLNERLPGSFTRHAGGVPIGK